MLSPKVRAIVHHASAPLTPTLHGATSRGGSGNFFPDSAAAAIAAAGSPGFQPSTPRSLEAGSPGGVLLNHTPLAPFSLDSPPHSAEPSPALGPHSAPASPSPLPADELVLRRPARPPELQGERSLQEFEIGTTIGTGSFGRVSLVRLASEPIKHKGFFALKVMKKADVIRLKQVEHIVNESSLLQTLAHPFICAQVCAFQDARRLYLLLEYVPGGELFSYLRRERVIPEKAARFYASEIVLCYHYLHGLNVAYRDLKPENVLLTRTGHVKLADFGFAKVVVGGRTWTLCGTPEYLAPEVVLNKGHGKSVDWWALGVLIFEMLAGFPPFCDDTPMQTYQKIVRGELEFPDYFDPRVRDVVSALLTADLTKRLGCLKDGTGDVMRHAWFAKVKWQSVLDRLVPAPFFPPLADAKDVSNFDVFDEPDFPAPLVAEEEDALFAGFGPHVAAHSVPWPEDNDAES